MDQLPDYVRAYSQWNQWRDITKSKDYIASEYLSTGNQVTAGLTAVSAFKQSGTGNLTYDPNLPHRIAILIGSGSVRGTSTNNSNGTNQPVISGGSAVAALNFNRGKTITYDFIPSTNKIKARQRDIVSVNTCNNCHKDVTATTTSGITTRGLIFHGAGGRNDVTQCVTCHTDQTKAQSTTGGDQVSSSYSFGATGNGFLLDGESVVDFPVMVHKFHMSSNLIKSGAGYYPASSSYPFPTKAAAFITKASSQLCYNCHTTNKTARNEDNWKTRPSKIACGACHDGLNFSSGLLTSVNRSNLMPTHGGGAQVDDSKCAGCHTTSNIISKHGL
ncbi:MAG: hypothetical protein K8R21_00885 [Leptospira sp.]|nr:hypothetical protein [Leptospira sp.]